MACSIEATAGHPSANSFATIAEADAYHETHVAGATWAAYTEDQKCRALQQATRHFMAYVRWFGWATSPTTQVLPFPRAGLRDPHTRLDVNSTTIPLALKWATAEQARLLLERDRSLETSQGQEGVKRIKAGAVELDFADAAGGGVLQTIAPSAWQLVATWGELNQAGQGGAVRLTRHVG